MKSFVRLMVVFALVAPMGAIAQEEGQGHSGKKKAPRKSLHDEFTGQGYGVAGCGLGSVVFGPKPGMIQVIAATTNDIGSNQTFGITSGTSNCDIPEMGQQAAAFIEVNKEVISKEAARGQGETVAGLAYIMKCADPALFGRGLQTNYEKIFHGSKSSYDSTRAILSLIESDRELRSSCNVDNSRDLQG